MNNATIPSADRGTHLKVVAVSLAASIIVLAVTVAARTMSPDTITQSAHGPVIKATKTVVTTSNDVSTIR